MIIAGFGRVGQIVGRILRMRRIPFTALEASVAQVDFVRRFGNKVYYGDASRLEAAARCRRGARRSFVLAIDDIDASVRTAELVREHFPNLKIMARARNRQHALRLMDLGVRYLIRETYLSSLDLAQQTLEALGMTRADAAESIQRFDAHDKKTAAGAARNPRRRAETDPDRRSTRRASWSSCSRRMRSRPQRHRARARKRGVSPDFLTEGAGSG